MTKTKSPQPVVFVFPLSDVGAWLKKRIPAQYADCPGYWFRSAHEDIASELQAIEEPEMSEKEADKMLGWVAEYVDSCMLREAIYTDEEHAALDEVDEDNHGFHPGVTLAEGMKALEAGGFRVVVAPFPQTLGSGSSGDARRAAQLDAIVSRLELHLDFASTTSALTFLKECDALSPNLRIVCAQLDNFLGAEKDDDLTKRLLAALPGWSGDRRDKLHLVFAQLAKEKLARDQELNPNIPRLRAALGAPESAKVKRASA